MESLHAVVDGRSRWRRQRPAVAAPPPAEDSGDREASTVEVDRTKIKEASPSEDENELLGDSREALNGKTTEIQKKLLHSETAIVPPQKGTSVPGHGDEKKTANQEEGDDGKKRRQKKTRQKREKKKMKLKVQKRKRLQKNTKMKERRRKR
ncbi:mucin-associated surface protein (MASP) [Trypanosoma cruzi]|nr:mucin-associated surface protein (MASP) [Trypanosoma cruzi]